MRFIQRVLDVETLGKLEVSDITKLVKRTLKESGVENGLLSVWTKHTTACLSVNERDEKLWSDLIDSLTRLIPVEGEYRHRPNAHAHIISTIVKPGVTIPFVDGELTLGTWQAVLLIELDGPRTRNIVVTIIGE